MTWKLPLLSAVVLLLASPGHAAPETLDDQGEQPTVIQGEVLKPEITVVISRENLNKAYELKLDENFLDRILDSVKHDPF